MATARPKTDLSIYLAKTSSDDPAAPIKKASALRKHKINLAKNCEAILFVRRPTANTPKWAKIFENHLSTKILVEMPQPEQSYPFHSIEKLF